MSISLENLEKRLRQRKIAYHGQDSLKAFERNMSVDEVEVKIEAFLFDKSPILTKDAIHEFILTLQREKENVPMKKVKTKVMLNKKSIKPAYIFEKTLISHSKASTISLLTSVATSVSKNSHPSNIALSYETMVIREKGKWNYEDLQEKEIDLEIIESLPGGMSYMCDLGFSLSDAIDFMLESFVDQWKSSTQNEISISHPGLPTAVDSYYAGIIRCDSCKVSKDSIRLETTQGYGNGCIVPVSFPEIVDAMCIFDGLFVILRGSNPSGSLIEVSEVCSASAHSSRHDNSRSEEFEPFNCLIACGPFTKSDSMDFSIFFDSLRRSLEECRCQCIILLGPLVHPDVASRLLGHEETLQNLLIEKLADLSSSERKIILIPSLSDVHHEYCYPQAAFSFSYPNIICLSNPSTFQINGIKIGITSVDSVQTLNTSMVTLGNIGKGRIAAIYETILSQKCYYPTFLNGKLPVDVQRIEYLNFNKTDDLDILIVPSILANFTESIKGTFCVNPGYFAKDKCFGTFALLQCHPLEPNGDNNDERIQPDSMYRVKIIKINENISS